MVTSSIAVKSVTTLLLTIYIEKWGITYDCIQELCMFVYPGTNVVSLFRLSVAKDAPGHSGDAKDPDAEPQNGESHMNSASGIYGYS
jgi:hypothetical protein